MTVLEQARQVCAEVRANFCQPVLRFTLEPGEPGLFESKVGGTPYLPRDMEWPTDCMEEPLILLAQVDCTALKSLPDFPHTGLLQFFVGQDEEYGLNPDALTVRDGFEVFYHETVDPSVTAEEVEAKRPPQPDAACSPLGGRPCRICFAAPAIQGLSESDYRFNDLFLDLWNERFPDTPLKTMYDFYKLLPEADQDCDIFSQFEAGTPRHQLGGYPHFNQSDPREFSRSTGLDVVLFQLDSDTQGSDPLVMWGDCGVCNFLINRMALSERDFSQVGYSWDCC